MIHVFKMDEETLERWRTGAIAFGRKMVEKGIDTIELDGRGVKISPDQDNSFLKGILFLGFKLYGYERVKIWKYGNPAAPAEVHIYHLDGESVLRIPDDE